MLVLSVTPEKAPDKETEITMTFEQGVPENTQRKSNEGFRDHHRAEQLAGENGIGIVDIVENRVLG